jgi:hypothetical protein
MNRFFFNSRQAGVEKSPSGRHPTVRKPFGQNGRKTARAASLCFYPVFFCPWYPFCLQVLSTEKKQ